MRPIRHRLLLSLLTGAALAGCSDSAPFLPEQPDEPERTDLLNPDPPDGAVRFVWFVPTDVAFDSATVAAIERAAWNTRSWFRATMGGRTFRFDEGFPVEVVFGDHAASWYEDRPNPYGWDAVWNANLWVDMEVKEKLSLVDWSPRWKVAIYMSAEGAGGASVGRLVIPQHDVDGVQDGNPNIHRFWGGLAHELGHTFDLPDADGDDGTIMSGALYAYPRATLPPGHIEAVLSNPRNAGYFPGSGPGVGPAFDAHAWYRIVNAATGQVVDLAAGNAAGQGAEGVAVVGADPSGAESQKWGFEARPDGTWQVRNRATGKLLAVRSAADVQGAVIEQQADGDATLQSWFVLALADGAYELAVPFNVRPNQSVKVLDVPGSAAGAPFGAPLVQRDYVTAETQAWRVERVPEG